jgi:hypothetical protein
MLYIMVLFGHYYFNFYYVDIWNFLKAELILFLFIFLVSIKLKLNLNLFLLNENIVIYL